MIRPRGAAIEHWIVCLPHQQGILRGKRDRVRSWKTREAAIRAVDRELSLEEAPRG